MYNCCSNIDFDLTGTDFDGPKLWTNHQFSVLCGKLLVFFTPSCFMKQVYLAHDLDDLPAIANELLVLVQQYRTVALGGDIGAGKTTLVKQLCTSLGVEDATSSPTFALVNEYAASVGTVYHLDLYRLQSVDEAFSIGLRELFDGKKYCFIDWPDLVTGYLPAQTLWIQVKSLENNSRQITVVLESDET